MIDVALKHAPDCVSRYRGVRIISMNRSLRHYVRMVHMLAFLPESILKRIYALYTEAVEGDDAVVAYLAPEHQTREDAATVIEHLDAAGQVYGHGALVVSIDDGATYDDIFALPCTGDDGAFFDADRWVDKAVPVQ